VLSEHTVADAVRAAGLRGEARYVEETGSTNADLLALAERGAPAWSVLAAGHQRAGRGRLGRTWVSDPGSSLLVSVLLRPQVDPREGPLLSLAAGAAAARACRAASSVQAGCKWPNDLVAGGRKLGGLLAEAKVDGGRLAHVVIGLGLNVGRLPAGLPTDLPASATSLADEGGAVAFVPLLTAYLRGLRVLASGPPVGVLEAYRGVSDTIGRAVRATTTGGEVVEGVAVDVGDAGDLIVETPGGERRVAFGEVARLR
jgi:BirA family biotin operon repressor/biotin-[acetyl-CoA-carboxylase] ligase